jgi:hypothetical protein
MLDGFITKSPKVTKYRFKYQKKELFDLDLQIKDLEKREIVLMNDIRTMEEELESFLENEVEEETTENNEPCGFKPGNDKPSDNKPGNDKPGGDKPSDDKTSDDKTSDHKAEDGNPEEEESDSE